MLTACMALFCPTSDAALPVSSYYVCTRSVRGGTAQSFFLKSRWELVGRKNGRSRLRFGTACGGRGGHAYGVGWGKAGVEKGVDVLLSLLACAPFPAFLTLSQVCRRPKAVGTWQADALHSPSWAAYYA